MENNHIELLNAIGYKFKDKSLLIRALSHRSYGKENNERLEFLGDAVLDFVMADELYRLFPTATEGQLSRMRSHLVNCDTLAEVGKSFNLGELLFLGQGEIKTGGSTRSSTISDATEALIGAILLDSNLAECHTTIIKWFRSRIDAISLDDIQKDAKSALQELLQSKQLSLPEYRLASITGEEHNQTFIIDCYIKSLGSSFRGTGLSRRRAEQDAASFALKEI
jgi:ribonuclease-3